jgi:NAD(P)-dependent dehydrogenase (short-subunit alcohol dehydrogenase family)
MDFNGKNVVVTGGSRGVGFQMCTLLLAHSASVLAVSRSAAKLDGARRELSNLSTLQADVGTPEGAAAIAAWVSQHWGRLDVLVNNAGIYLDTDDDLLAQPDAVFLDTMRVNVTGPYLCAKRLAPLLLKSDDPRIVNVGSTMGVMTPGLSGTYSVSKATLNALTIALANELRGRVAVNCLSPGWVRTDMAPTAPGDSKHSAEDLLWLLNKPRTVTGKFFGGRRELRWAE